MSAEFYIGNKDYSHNSIPKIGVLLTNLGTPDAPTPKAVRRYLKQFLWDPRVIELPRWKWWFVLNFLVLTTRPKRVAENYKSIWTGEGSPLLVTTRSQASKLAQRLTKRVGNPLSVEVAMRYGNPSIESALEKMRKDGVDRLLVLPMYGQYSSASAGSTFDVVADVLKTWRYIPSLHTMMQFHDDPGYISCLRRSVLDFWEKNGRSEKLLMSFHGYPKRYLLNGDPYPCHCHKTARLLGEALSLSREDYIVSFQSLFGKEEWVRPYTDETLRSLPGAGVRSVDVICPGFLSDCLETVDEIEVENRENFINAGGEQYRYIAALNDRDDFIDELSEMVLKHLGPWSVPAEEWDSQRAEKEAENSAECFKQANSR